MILGSPTLSYLEHPINQKNPSPGIPVFELQRNYIFLVIKIHRAGTLSRVMQALLPYSLL